MEEQKPLSFEQFQNLFQLICLFNQGSSAINLNSGQFLKSYTDRSGALVAEVEYKTLTPNGNGTLIYRFTQKPTIQGERLFKPANQVSDDYINKMQQKYNIMQIKGLKQENFGLETNNYLLITNNVVTHLLRSTSPIFGLSLPSTYSLESIEDIEVLFLSKMDKANFQLQKCFENYKPTK